jgi:hypothetical protein
MKLYRSHQNPTRWYAFEPGAGFVMFPAEPGGWARRRQARGFDPIDVREVPLSLACETGILEPESNCLTEGNSELPAAA